MLICLAILCLAGCKERQENMLQGYVEGEFVYIAAPIEGKLESLFVDKGAQAKSGDKLFTLESEYEREGLHYASNELLRAMSTVADLQKGDRPTEIAQIQARLKSAEAELELAHKEYQRRTALYKKRLIAKEELDKQSTNYKSAVQTVQQIHSELETAGQGSRSDQIKAAQAEVDAAKAQVHQAQWSVEQKTQHAPTHGLVFDVLYRRGEYVATGAPVISFLPPENRKIRFFIPETMLSAMKLGMPVEVSYDGGAPLKARITYISAQSEYTPPVIYSSQSRMKLVFMIEAVPSAEDALKLHPGQPVDVRLPGLTIPQGA